MICACPLGKELDESALIGSWQFLSRHLKASWTYKKLNTVFNKKFPDCVHSYESETPLMGHVIIHEF